MARPATRSETRPRRARAPEYGSAYARGMDSTRTLAVELFHRVRSQSGNLLISPYSVWLAVAMLHPGARGKTRDALSAVLGIDDVAAVRRLGSELAKRKEPTGWQRDQVARGYQQASSYGFHLDI